MSEIKVLFEGYSVFCQQKHGNISLDDIDLKNTMKANCTCSLILGPNKIIVDTMTAWDTDRILSALQKYNVTPDEIDYVISTHGHSDHIGNNNLFLKAKHIVGYSISFKDQYFPHDFDKGTEYVINNNVRVIPTPGHTLSDVTVLVDTINDGTVAITGDLFEKFEDIENPLIWIEAGSENEHLQLQNRSSVADRVNSIIPGHGPIFQVTENIRMTLKRQATKT